ncbi:MAG: hypothetical protein ACR2J0_08670, partial [Mycobacteriales bacterium]
MTVTSTAFPAAVSPAEPVPEPSPEPGGRRRLLLLAALAVLAFSLVGAYLLLAGSAAEPASGPVAGVRRPSPAPTA